MDSRLVFDITEGGTLLLEYVNSSQARADIPIWIPTRSLEDIGKAMVSQKIRNTFKFYDKEAPDT